MKVFSTRTHGVLDYITGILLILAPWIFNFDNGGPAQWVPVVVGVIVLFMAFITNYEAGMIKSIPMPFHLTMDVIAGLFLAISPWLFGFSELVYLPHLLVGLFMVFSGLTTQRRPSIVHSITH